ncbi:response regulator [Marinibacterium profundimaris]|uniref:response regulator n=1 Tax=Marinibacterium profundimaris TaxID=1679460 RepID=UPI00130349C2|nr:response regulator [Marinibacterium profundimaris]
MRVLAVDDDQSILALLQTALSALGLFEVSIADSGEEALRQIERAEKPFDCFLLDIQMPHMNGIELCREIRAMRAHHKTPIVMLTAMSERKYIDESFVAGATDYVTKPFDFYELRSRLSAAQRILQEHARANDSVEVARKLKQDLDSNLAIALSDPIAMNGIDRMLGFTEFENYIMQLNRTKRFTSHVMAIRVRDVEQHFDQMSNADFREAIQETGRALSKFTRKMGNILSYRGNGVFLCVCHGKASVLTPEQNEPLNRMLATMMSSRRFDVTFELEFGPPVSLRLTTRSGALYSLAKAATALDATPGVVSSKLMRLGRGQAKQSQSQRNDRLAYEAILQDLLAEEPSLNRY